MLCSTQCLPFFVEMRALNTTPKKKWSIRCPLLFRVVLVNPTATPSNGRIATRCNNHCYPLQFGRGLCASVACVALRVRLLSHYAQKRPEHWKAIRSWLCGTLTRGRHLIGFRSWKAIKMEKNDEPKRSTPRGVGESRKLGFLVKKKSLFFKI